MHITSGTLWFSPFLPSNSCHRPLTEKYTRSSLITLTTIGYGANTVFHNSCWTVSAIITVEALFGLLIDATVVGLMFVKIGAGGPRGVSVNFSKRAIIRRVGDQLFFTFRVAETRKLQLCEAHVRVYAVMTDTRDDGTPLLFQSHVCRLVQPDDELGGMLLLMLPSEVVHGIDAWSPLLPPNCLPCTAKKPLPNDVAVHEDRSMYSYSYPEVRQRQMDVRSGNRSAVECTVSGENFQSEEAHRRHHQRENIPDGSCRTLPQALPPTTHKSPDMQPDEDIAVPPTSVSAGVPTEAALRAHFKKKDVEILIIVEGIDATLSCTLQACYSYREADIVFDAFFKPCTRRDDDGRCVIDYAAFQEIEPIRNANNGNAAAMISAKETTPKMANDPL